MIGHVLDNRYKILEKIGTGGMANVFKARDVLLDRIVAVKVLHANYASDHDFVTRFKREAQAAAKLSHPNIVNIYDVGYDEDVHYIVMEYIRGKTLKEYIDQQGHLPIEIAVKITIEIGEALEHAHANGIIHCDIKPHNILVTESGRIKVADFGIARAVNSGTMIKTTSVLGSVHYFSPEQASGKPIDERTDIYSLGIVLYEMVTGVLPFQGDTPISVALKHVQDELPLPTKFNPAIPALLEGCIVKALAKNPNDRFQTASEMMSELRLSQGFVTMKSHRIIKNDFATQVLLPAKIKPKATWGQRVTDFISNRSRKSIIISMTLIFLMAFLWAFFSFGNFWSTKEISVPDVTGKQVEIARQILEKEDLLVSVNEVSSSDVPIGQVINQSPGSGSKVKAKRTIYLTVSKGGGSAILIPNLRGLTVSEASTKLESIGLSLGRITEGSDASVPDNTIISQSPTSPQKAEKGTTVDVIVNKKSTEKVKMPNVTGLSLEDALKAISKANLSVGTIANLDSSRANSEAKVKSQTPVSGETVASSTSVDLVVEYTGKPNTPGANGTGTSAENSKSGTIDITVPQGAGAQHVQIIIIDDNGKRVVYDNKQRGGDQVSRAVSGVGKVRVQVYINDVLVQDQLL